MKKKQFLYLLILLLFLYGCGGNNSPLLPSSQNQSSLSEEELQKNLLKEVYSQLNGNTLMEINGVIMKNGFLYPERIPVEYKILNDEELKEKLYEDYGSVNKFIESLGEPYTKYITKNEYENMINKLQQKEYGGVGMALGLKEGKTVILSVFSDSPAEKAGISVGDIILEVDGMPTDNMSVEEISSKIKGTAGTSVSLTIQRGTGTGGEIIKIVLIRENIIYPSVKFSIIEGNLGYIKINFFGSDTADEIKEDISDNIAGIDALIIDLRSNPGGFLTTSITSSDLFLSTGKIINIQDSSKTVQPIQSDTEIITSLPIALLINEYSASASEIFAGALKDNEAGVIIGEKSFGKGTIQTIRTLSDGSAVTVTIAKFFTPLMNEVDEVGIMPDIYVEEKEEDLQAGKDLILDKAKEYLKPVI